MCVQRTSLWPKVSAPTYGKAAMRAATSGTPIPVTMS
jgi:hypothetical protein